MRIVFRSNGQQYLIKCCRKPITTPNAGILKGGKAGKFLKVSLAKRIRKNRRIIKTKNIVPAPVEVKFQQPKIVSSSSSSSSSSGAIVPPLLKTISSTTSSSSSSLLQTLPSPTDEFKSWPSSTSPEIENDVQQQQQQQQEQENQKSENENDKNSVSDSVVEENRNIERQQHILNIAIAMNDFWSERNPSFDSTNNNNSSSNAQTGRLTAEVFRNALIWQKYKGRIQCFDNRLRQTQSSSITQRRPQSESEINHNNNINSNNSNNNNSNNNNRDNSININVNNSLNSSNINRGVKRPLVQDDPNEPEPTSSENIKRIKVANGYQNVAILDERYLFIRKIEGTSFYYCIDAMARKRLMCKVSLDPCTKLIEAHARLNGHPCISQLLKVIRKDNKTYMFFPMAQDDLLSYVRRRKRLPERDARFLFRQMCAIVRSCHNQGIVLRDLKLRKFIFSDGLKKHLKLESLVDAVVLDEPTNDLLKEKRGCPVYVAPEILKTTQTYCGKAADMWSLGVILYTMLIGRYPFSDTEHAALFAKISRGQFTLPDIISPKARCIIRCLLRQEPEERITSEDIFYHPWMNVNDATEINLLQTDQCVPTNDSVGRENCGNKIIN